jgi:selenocysteine-specific elongation factor
MTVVIGTAGHIDHGKTTLLRALTGIDADRLPEEQRRGMTIDVGYAHLRLDDGSEIDFVDVPGHDRLVGNMLVGAGEIDAALIVVAADDGPRAQTLEHLELLDALGIGDGLAVVTKIDAVEPARVAAVVDEVRRLLDRTRFAGSPVIAASGVSGAGIDGVRAAIIGLRDRIVARAVAGGPARLAIDRVFSVKGRGAVVTGTLRGGPLERGMRLRIVPGAALARIREIQVHGSATEQVIAGGRTALNLAGVEASDLRRGMVLAPGDEVVASDRVLVALRPAAGLLDAATWPPHDRARVRLHVGTDQLGATVGRSARDAVDLPGGEVTAILRLQRPAAVAAGDRLVLRRPSPRGTVAGGRILDVDPPRGISRRRATPERLARLAVTDGRDARARLDLHGAIADSPRGVALAPDVATAIADAAVAAAASWDGPIRLSTLRSATVTELRRLATLGEPAGVAAATRTVDDLIAAGRLIRDGDRIEVPGRAAATGPDPGFLVAMDRLQVALDVPAPPSLADAARVVNCPPAGIRELERTGRIVRLGDDLAWSAAAYRQLEAAALALAAAGPLTPAALRDATGTSRKYVMAILEDLGRRGVLRRTADGHVPGPRAGTATAGAAPTTR